jgi:hypothetical protein
MAKRAYFFSLRIFYAEAAAGRENAVLCVS